MVDASLVSKIKTQFDGSQFTKQIFEAAAAAGNWQRKSYSPCICLKGRGSRSADSSRNIPKILSEVGGTPQNTISANNISNKNFKAK